MASGIVGGRLIIILPCRQLVSPCGLVARNTGTVIWQSSAGRDTGCDGKLWPAGASLVRLRLGARGRGIPRELRCFTAHSGDAGDCARPWSDRGGGVLRDVALMGLAG